MGSTYICVRPVRIIIFKIFYVDFSGLHFWIRNILQDKFEIWPKCQKINHKVLKYLQVVEPSILIMHWVFRCISRLLNGLTRTATFTDDIVVCFFVCLLIGL